jgi:hypothetical protein
MVYLPLPFTAHKTYKGFCMKKLFFLLLPVLFLSSCVSIKDPVMLNKSFPSPDKYEILGKISVDGTRYGILGLFWLGGVEWLDLLYEANLEFGHVDDVVSVSVDTGVFSVFGIITQQRITMRGTAIRYITEPSRTP